MVLLTEVKIGGVDVGPTGTNIIRTWEMAKTFGKYIRLMKIITSTTVLNALGITDVNDILTKSVTVKI